MKVISAGDARAILKKMKGRGGAKPVRPVYCVERSPGVWNVYIHPARGRGLLCIEAHADFLPGWKATTMPILKRLVAHTLDLDLEDLGWTKL